MKVVSTTVIAAVLAAAPASGAIVFYEGFDYPAGEGLEDKVNPSNGHDWDRAGAVTTPTPQIVAGSLSVPTGVAPPTGNKVEIVSNPTRAERLNFSAIGSGTVYYSLVFRATNLDSQVGTDVNGSFFAALNNGNADAGTATAPTVVGARLQVRRDASDAELTTGATKFNIGLNNSGAAGLTSWDDGVYNVNEDIFVLASYTINNPFTVQTDDVARLWINPNLATFDPDTTPVDATVTGGDLGSPGAQAFILRAVGGIPTLQVDEIRVGTTYQSVIPEPSALALAGVALLGLGRRRRHRA